MSMEHWWKNSDKENQVHHYSVGICVSHLNSLIDFMDFSIVCTDI